MNHEIPEQPEELMQPPHEGFAFMALRIEEQLNSIERQYEVVAHKPTAGEESVLRDVLEGHIKSIHKTLEVLREEYETEEDAFPGLMRYVVGLEHRRVAFLNELGLGDEKFFVASGGDADVISEKLLEQGYDDAIRTAYSYYHQNINVDYNTLVETAEEVYSEKPSTKRKERLHMVGRHALGVAKIALGVVSGIAVAKRAKLL